MIREWLFGREEKEEVEKPPKPDPKEETHTHRVMKTNAYWPGSNGPVEVAFEDTYGMWKSEDWYRDYEIRTDENGIPQVTGTLVMKAHENVTLEEPEIAFEVKETYQKAPYWCETDNWGDPVNEWRFKKDPETVEREVV